MASPPGRDSSTNAPSGPKVRQGIRNFFGLPAGERVGEPGPGERPVAVGGPAGEGPGPCGPAPRPPRGETHPYPPRGGGGNARPPPPGGGRVGEGVRACGGPGR